MLVALHGPLVHVIEGLEAGVFLQIELWVVLLLGECHKMVYLRLDQVVSLQMDVEFAPCPISFPFDAGLFVFVHSKVAEALPIDRAVLVQGIEEFFSHERVLEDALGGADRTLGHDGSTTQGP